MAQRYGRGGRRGAGGGGGPPQPQYTIAQPQRVTEASSTSRQSPTPFHAQQPVKILLGPRKAAEDAESKSTTQPSPIPSTSQGTQPSPRPRIQERVHEERSSASSCVPPDEFKPMSAALRLFDDNLEFSEFTQEYLSDSNTGYHVIGAIGPQGTGKSTLLSMLAGNEPLDLYRQYVFRPCSREAVESCRYQTTKIYAYVTKARTILLDCQALNSAAILDDWLRSQRRHTGPRRVLEGFEAEAAQLLMFLFEVCHTLLFCVDWFIDLNAVRELMRTEVFAELRPEEAAGRKRDVNIVVVHQRAKSVDFKPAVVRERARILRGIFENSRLKVCGGISMGRMGFQQYGTIEPDVNYVLLSDIKPRGRGGASDAPGPHGYEHSPIRGLTIEYAEVIKKLRMQLLELPRNQWTANDPTEREWYQYAVRTWHRVRQELADYDSTDMGRALPRGMLIENRHRTRQYAHTATDDRRSSINSPPPLEESEEEGDA